jgi:hypothetical protein
MRKLIGDVSVPCGLLNQLFGYKQLPVDFATQKFICHADHL